MAASELFVCFVRGDEYMTQVLLERNHRAVQAAFSVAIIVAGLVAQLELRFSLVLRYERRLLFSGKNNHRITGAHLAHYFHRGL